MFNYNQNKNNSSELGFTLIEILLSIAIIIIIASLTVPVALTVYDRQMNQSATDEIFTALKKAQAYSMLAKNDSQYGVKFDNVNNYFVLFQGNTYSELDIQNEKTFIYSNEVTFSPTINDSIILFEKNSGLPTTTNPTFAATTTLTVSIDNISKDIIVCETGLIEMGDSCD